MTAPDAGTRPDHAPDAKAFRAAVGAFAGNISIITAEAGGEASGLVCTSVVSPSADPPLLLAVLNAASSTWGLIERSSAFGWSSVGAAQEAVARRFSIVVSSCITLLKPCAPRCRLIFR